VSSRGGPERLEDILESVDSIRRPRSLLDTGTDEALVHDAVLHRFTVIGEAVGQLPAELLATEPTIAWAAVRGLRNAIAHAYFDISMPLLWDVVDRDLRPLADACGRLLATLPGDAFRARDPDEDEP